MSLTLAELSVKTHCPLWCHKRWFLTPASFNAHVIVDKAEVSLWLLCPADNKNKFLMWLWDNMRTLILNSVPLCAAQATKSNPIEAVNAPNTEPSYSKIWSHACRSALPMKNYVEDLLRILIFHLMLRRTPAARPNISFLAFSLAQNEQRN